jgi:tetratricopeptide (TPR) repeat protein
MACLDKRRAELRVATDLLVHADRALAAKAIDLAESLSPLADCANTEALLSPVRLPADPGVRARVAAVQTELASAKANEAAGRYAAGLPFAQAAADEARKIGYRPLEAEALVQLGALQDWAGDATTAAATYAAAANAAIAGRSDLALARALTDAIWVAGYDLRHFDEAERLAQLAHGALERLGGSPRVEAQLLGYEGAVLLAKGDADAALEHHRKALAIQTAHGLDTAMTLNNIALVQQRKGDDAGALASYQQVLASQEKQLGGQHPDVALVLNNIGFTQQRLGHYDEAYAALQRALAIREGVLGPDHPQVAGTLDNLSAVLVDLKRYDDAVAAAQRGLAIAEKSLGPDHPELAAIHFDLGVALMYAAHYPDAQAHFARSLELTRKAAGGDTADLAPALIELGELQLRQQHAAAAIAPIERALALVEKGGDPTVLANGRYLLGKALWETGAHDRALALAHEARDGLAAAGGQADSLAEVDQWLAVHAH